MGSGFSKLKKQAKQFEQQYSDMQKEMQAQRFKGISSGDLVTVTVNGEKKLVDLTIKKECVDPEDTEGLIDLIKEAYIEAFTKAEAASESQNTGGMPFPL